MEKVSVVIPTVRGKSIFDTISGLLENTLLPYEIIIIDQANSLNQEFIKRFKTEVVIHLIIDNGKGAARARNIGWKKALGEIIAFIDDDAVPSKLWIESIVNSFHKSQNNKVGIVGGKIIPVYKEKNVDWEIPKEFEFMLPAFDQGEEAGEYLKGALPASVNMAISKALFQKTGGFNEKLGTNDSNKVQVFGEDTDLSIRIKSLGFNLFYNPAATVYHPVPLKRQNKTFFKKRAYTEGFTMAYLDCNTHHFSTTKLIYIIYNELKKQIKLSISKRNSDIAIGWINYSKGYLKGIVYFGFLKN